MKTSSLALLGLLVAGCSNSLFDGTAAEAKEDGRFIVRVEDGDALERSLPGSGVALVKRMKFEKATVVTGSERAAQNLASRFGGRVEPDLAYSIPSANGNGKGGPSTPPQPAQTVPWGISKINASLAGTRGNGVRVCISDTGIDLSHPDLQANIVSQVNTINPAKSAQDDNGHGSHVAGTIAALDNTIGVVGVAPEAKLIAAKGLSRSGSGFSSDLAETIDECRLRGAQVINMSWGSSSPSQVILDAIRRASTAGIWMMAAAGNNSGPVGYPAAFGEVIAISAVDNSDALAYFSSFGPEVENSAPGVNILSTWMGGGYKTISGTSMASPHAAGVAALILSLNPTATRDRLRGVDIGLSADKQGSRGRIDAVLSTSP